MRHCTQGLSERFIGGAAFCYEKQWFGLPRPLNLFGYKSRFGYSLGTHLGIKNIDIYRHYITILLFVPMYPKISMLFIGAKKIFLSCDVSSSGEIFLFSSLKTHKFCWVHGYIGYNRVRTPLFTNLLGTNSGTML